MGAAISKSNKEYINKNWGKLKCSPIGPFLQMLGIGPGNASDTTTACKSSEFSAQFNSSMSEHIGVTNKLAEGLGAVNNLNQGFRKVIASIQQTAFDDLSIVATQLFALYAKIGNLFYIITKNLINIINIFKSTLNLGASITKLLIEFMNLLRFPVNGVINFVQFFSRGV
jgi:hypothetical protein